MSVSTLIVFLSGYLDYIFILVCSLIAFGVLLWAIRHRQLQGSEEAKYAVFDAGTTLANQPRAWTGRMWMMMGAILCVFGFIAWSVVVTIIAATHTPIQPLDAPHSAPSPM